MMSLKFPGEKEEKETFSWQKYSLKNKIILKTSSKKH